MPAVPRRTQAPASPDLSNIPMTPAMVQMQILSAAAADLKAVTDHLSACAIDASEVAWGEEKQNASSIARVQGKPANQTAAFYKQMVNRGIDTSQGGFNDHRKREPIQPRPLPSYLTDPEFEEIAEEALRLRQRIERMTESRARQYPRLHQRVLDGRKQALKELAERKAG
ncbi:hypothetical protein [Streptomyces sp. NPDC054838]